MLLLTIVVLVAIAAAAFIWWRRRERQAPSRPDVPTFKDRFKKRPLEERFVPNPDEPLPRRNVEEVPPLYGARSFRDRLESAITRSGNGAASGRLGQLPIRFASELAAIDRVGSVVPRMLARAPGAEAEFRALLETASRRFGAEGFPALDERMHGFSRELPCAFPSEPYLRLAYVGAGAIARDEKDWDRLLNGADALFRINEWGETINGALRHLERTGDAGPLMDRGSQFLGLPEEMPLPDGPSGGAIPTPEPTRGTIPRPVFDLCQMKQWKCMGGLRGIVLSMVYLKRGLFYPIDEMEYLHSNGITSIVPDHACAGQQIAINGSGFGAPQPAGIHLVVPSHIPGYGTASRILPVPPGQWTDTQITVIVPDWVRSGTIGFLDEAALARWEEFAQWVGDILEATQETITVLEGSYGCSTGNSVAVVTQPVPLFPLPADIGTNMFWGTIPEIRFPGYDDGHAVIAPGFFALPWEVIGAAAAAGSIRIQKLPNYMFGDLFPDIDLMLSGGNRVTGSVSLNFGIGRDGDPIYRFTATNACGTVTRDLRVHVRQPVTVSVRGLELVQASQQFVMDDTNDQNPIPLVDGKATALRVYLDAPLPSGYQPLNYPAIGEVRVTPVSFAGGPGYPWAPYPWTHDRGGCSLQALTQSRRDSITGSLNIMLPAEACRETVQLDLSIRSADPYAVWPAITHTTTATFESGQTLNLHIFRVEDRYGNLTSDDEIADALAKLRAILPVAEAGGIRVVGIDTIFTDLDFEDDDAWKEYSMFSTDMFDELENAAQDHPGLDGVYCAIIPQASRTNAKGVGWPGGLDWIGGTSERIAYWRASVGSNNYIEAHEIGHALNLNHTTGQVDHPAFDIRDMLSPRFISPSEWQVMDDGHNSRWVNHGEYLHFLGFGFESMVETCTEHSLDCDVSSFYLGI